MCGRPVLERHEVPGKASEAATQLDNAFLGRQASLESVAQISDWLHEEACKMRRRNDLTSFRPLGFRELVAPGRDDLTQTDDVAEQMELASRSLRRTLAAINGGNFALAAEARDFMLRLFSFTHGELRSRGRPRYLFA